MQKIAQLDRPRRRTKLAALATALALAVACRGQPAVLAPPAAAETEPAPLSSPPTPLATDWKGLFDSDSQPSNVAPSAESAALVLRRAPGCSRGATSASGAFTATHSAQTAYLLSCGATHRVLIANEQAVVTTLDVSEDTLATAGDLELDGRDELLLLDHSGPNTVVRVLHFDGPQLATMYLLIAPAAPCAHTVVLYRFVKPKVELRVDRPAKRCTP